MRTGETTPIDQEIVRLTGKTRPRALFLPTASFDARDYAESFESQYGNLGCETDALFLWDGYSPEEIEATIQATKWNAEPHHWEFRGDLDDVATMIAAADLIYVGGGNTKRMLELWRSIGVDRMLTDAAHKGTVLAGLSAGCICWGRYGNSDYALTEGLGKPTGRIDGLDYLPVALCPHMSREPFRLEEFKAMMRETPGVGIGLDDGCALEVVDEKYRIISCVDGAVAHRLTADTYWLLHPSDEWRSVASLIA